jgi:hypothetical protein
MEPIGYPETVVTNYHSTLREIPEERRFQSGGKYYFPYKEFRIPGFRLLLVLYHKPLRQAVIQLGHSGVVVLCLPTQRVTLLGTMVY